jgi:predicted MPP superfamily phosphohydrolase
MLSLVLITLAASINVEQVHVASGPTPSSASVTWSTRFNCTQSQVRLGLSPCEESSCFSHYFNGTSAELSTGNNTQFIHKVLVTLNPSTTYSYEVGCSAGWSRQFSLRTAKQSGPNTFVVLADLSTLGAGKATWAVIQSRLDTLTVDAIIHVGDIAYDLFDDDNRLGDNYMNTLEPVVSRVPYMVVAGNHEEPDDYQSYDSRFTMPGNNFYHTYTIGLVRFVGINTESILFQDNMTQPTLDFLETTLNRTEEDKVMYPWLVVLGHRPLYCSQAYNADFPTCFDEAEVIRGQIEDLLYDYQVDLYIDGHVHNYQRTTAVYNNTPLETTSDVEFGYIDPKAPIYITTGGPGSDESQVPLESNATLTWYVTGAEELTYSVMTAYNSTHLWWEQWFSEVDALADSFWVVKSSIKG